MSEGLIVSIVGLAVAGFSSLLAVWLERDPDKPKKTSIALSILIVLATGAGVEQAKLSDEDSDKMQADIARVLASLDKITSNSDVKLPELDDLLKAEINA